MVRESIVIATAAAALVVGCSRSAPEPAAAVDPALAQPARTPTVIDDQLKALDKAKAVQATMDKQAAETKKAIDDAGG